MAASITIQYFRSEIEANLQSYDLRVLVESATDMPEEIFVFQRGAAPAPGSGDEATDRFTCIADPVDLEEYPPNAPDLDNEIPYYRLKEATFSLRSMEILENLQTDIANDIQRLVDSLKAAESLSLTEEVTYA